MKSILLKYIILLIASSLLNACGQAGRLYLPSKETPVQTQANTNKA